jgi:hypothetical protein
MFLVLHQVHGGRGGLIMSACWNHAVGMAGEMVGIWVQVCH